MRAWIESLAARHWWQARPTALCRLLWPLSLVYRALLAVRPAPAAPAAQALPVPVIVVGNLVVGGAGKTPTVMAIVQALKARGRQPGIVSRGYGRRAAGEVAVAIDSNPREVGDEPLLMRRRCLVPVWVGRDRSAAARALLRAHPQVDVIVSDDGLQHTALARQAEVVVFDERGAGNGLLLPAGPLREPLQARGAVPRVVLYTAGVASTPLPGLLAQRRIDKAWPLAAWHAGDATQAVALSHLQGRALTAVAGIAAPDKFFGMLRAAGLSITALPLPDHHPFDALPWAPDAPEVVMTEKDAIKIDPARVHGTAVWVLPLDLAVPDELIAAFLLP